MTDDDDLAPFSGWWMIAVGLVLAGFAALVLGTDSEDAPPAAAGYALLAAASVATTVGSVAVGVTMGLRRADHLRSR